MNVVKLAKAQIDGSVPLYRLAEGDKFRVTYDIEDAKHVLTKSDDYLFPLELLFGRDKSKIYQYDINCNDFDAYMVVLVGELDVVLPMPKEQPVTHRLDGNWLKD